jgi:DNA-binding transcriptional LysR family regulator
MDRFAEIETFVRVAETGGIGTAADRLGVAKSAVSRRLKDLEERLGVRLVNRTTRRLSLTETGRAYYERAITLLADLDEADQAAAAIHGTLTGRMRIAAPLSFGIRHLSAAISDFLCRHEALSIDLDLNDRQVDLVEDGFDLAVRIGVLEDSSLIARKLFDVRTVMCASPAYLERHGTPQRPEDLVDHAGFLYTNMPERRAWAWTTPDGEERTVQMTARLAANNGDLLLEAAEAGLGICIQPSFIAYRAIEDGRLVPVLPDVVWRRTACYAIYPPGRHLSAKVRALVDFLAARYAGTPYWDTCLEQGTAE